MQIPGYATATLQSVSFPKLTASRIDTEDTAVKHAES